MNLAGRGSVFLVSWTRLVESRLLSMSRPFTIKIGLFTSAANKTMPCLLCPLSSRERASRAVELRFRSCVVWRYQFDVFRLEKK